MKLFIITILCLVSNLAYAKPLKIENSQGKLIRCGDLKNTEGAFVIRGCPELGDFLDHDPTPEPTPEPNPTPVPTIQETPRPVTCEYRFVETSEGLKLNRVFPVGEIVHTCAYMGPISSFFVELGSVNGSKASCPAYTITATSPSGKQFDPAGNKYESTAVQPGMPLYTEVGTWQIDVYLIPGTECAKPYDLNILIRTKG